MESYVILDGYTDEPAGLGVPPYLDVYPRYVAGAIWHVKPSATIFYFTIDAVRKNISRFLSLANKAKAVIFIAGVSVPGKYLGGTPIQVEEIEHLSSLLENPIKILGGPAAMFGIGREGGTIADFPLEIKGNFDLIARGDLEEIVYEYLLENSLERVDELKLREDYSKVDVFAVKGARIVLQHPNYGRNLIVEIETFRGCPRYISGGCSFCIEPLYGRVIFRETKSILKEIETLYSYGVRNFRIGRQTDIYAYMATDAGVEEFPKPNPKAIENLFKGIRWVAPRIKVLHVDNANPGMIACYPEEAVKITKIIVMYHTPGDVLALGVESADPRVVKLNNLKAYPEDAMTAIQIINKVGAIRGYNGMPHLLPGVNFVCGLIGERKETYRLNLEFLREVKERGLLLRRINIRQVMVFPRTRMSMYGTRIIEKHKRYFKVFKERVRKEIDLPMLRKIVPRGTILREVFTEVYEGKNTLGRQVGSYPLLIYIPEIYPLKTFIHVVVINHGYRSVSGIPYPLNVNKASRRLLERVPGLGRSSIAKIISQRPFNDLTKLHAIIGDIEAIQWMSIK